MSEEETETTTAIPATKNRIKSFMKKTKEQEQRISQLPKVTEDNAFPEHVMPSEKELNKYQTKKSPAEYRTNPKGGCDY